MKGGLALIYFALFCLCAFAQPNYQERVLYYSQSDNVCRFGAKSDSMNIIINVDDSGVIRAKMSGYTYCVETKRNSEAIRAVDWTAFMNSDVLIDFEQTVTYKYLLGELIHLTSIITVRNPAKMYEKPYTCTVLGDGTRQHFGTEFTTSDPAEIYVRCVADGEEQKSGNLIQEK